MELHRGRSYLDPATSERAKREGWSKTTYVHVEFDASCSQSLCKSCVNISITNTTSLLQFVRDFTFSNRIQLAINVNVTVSRLFEVLVVDQYRVVIHRHRLLKFRVLSHLDRALPLSPSLSLAQII